MSDSKETAPSTKNPRAEVLAGSNSRGDMLIAYASDSRTGAAILHVMSVMDELQAQVRKFGEESFPGNVHIDEIIANEKDLRNRLIEEQAGHDTSGRLVVDVSLLVACTIIGVLAVTYVLGPFFSSVVPAQSAALALAVILLILLIAAGVGRGVYKDWREQRLTPTRVLINDVTALNSSIGQRIDALQRERADYLDRKQAAINRIQKTLVDILEQLKAMSLGESFGGRPNYAMQKAIHQRTGEHLADHLSKPMDDDTDEA